MHAVSQLPATVAAAAATDDDDADDAGDTRRLNALSAVMVK